MKRRWGWLVLLGCIEAAALLGACGSRTGIPEEDGAQPVVPAADAYPDLFFDRSLPPKPMPTPVPPPGPPPVPTPRDASVLDARADRSIFDAPFDRSVFDVLPPIDANPFPDVVRNDCPDAAATLVYVVTEQAELFSFYPPTLTFTRIGAVVCPSGDATPYSMAVDRKGKAYVVYSDGNLFAVSTATAACVATAFVPGQQGFTTFGMGFASDTNGAAEALYVTRNNVAQSSLATIDTATYVLRTIAPISPSITRAELTGTGDGRLYGFFTNEAPAVSGSRLIEIDKGTAQTLANNDLPVGRPNDAWAFAYWGGDFWIFTSPGGTSTVTRFRPSDSTTVNLATMPSTIVGAGVSTCAPQ